MTHEDLRIYLFVRKWRLKGITPSTLEFETRGKNGLLGIEIPTDCSSKDYNRRILGAVLDLSAIEGRSPFVIEAEIVKFATPTLVDKLAYLLIGLAIFAFSLYSWVILWSL